VVEVIEYMGLCGTTVDTELHDGKAHNLFAFRHILLGYKTTHAEMDGKYSYNTHKATAIYTDFTFSAYMPEREHLEDLNIHVRG
jgi:hypothetical protein